MSIASRARHTKRPSNMHRHVPKKYGYEQSTLNAYGLLESRINWPEGYKLDGTTVKRIKQEPK